MGAYQNSELTVSGGSIGWSLYAWDSSQVTLSGGSIGNDIIAGNNSDDESLITFLGSDFAIDGEPFGYGELTSIFGERWDHEPTRRLTGRLASGDWLDNDFYIAGDSRIVLAVPEPATVALMAFGLAAVAAARRGKPDA